MTTSSTPKGKVSRPVKSKASGQFVVIDQAGTIRKPDTRTKRVAGVLYGEFTETPSDKFRLSPSFFAERYLDDPMTVVHVVKSGVNAGWVEVIANRMHVPAKKLGHTLGFSTRVNSKITKATALSQEESSRLVGVARLIGQVQTMVEQSGDPAGFDSAVWVADWLDRGLPALNGKKPSEFMDSAEGQNMVSHLLIQVQGGAYA